MMTRTQVLHIIVTTPQSIKKETAPIQLLQKLCSPSLRLPPHKVCPILKPCFLVHQSHQQTRTLCWNLSIHTNIVTESTIIATIHCPQVGYYLFGNPLVTHIPYHVSCIFLIVIVSYWVVLSLVRLLAPLAPCTQLGYSMLPTMYYWISTLVAISYLFDSITCFVSYILSPLYLCFKT